MRVFCINDKGWIYSTPQKKTVSYFFGLIKRTIRFTKESTGPEYGDIDLVIGYETMGDKTYYILKGWEDNGSFNSDGFYPISELENPDPAEKEKIPNVL